MFETAELGHTVAKTVFHRAVPKLRSDLLDAQYRLKENGTFPVIILIAGVRGAGKGETVNLLNEWMDPRHIHTHAFGDALGRGARAAADVALLARAAAQGQDRHLLRLLVHRRRSSTASSGTTRPRRARPQSIEEINRFEKMLADEGALILKFWFHLSKEAQRKRLKALEKDPETRWRVTKRDWDHFKTLRQLLQDLRASAARDQHRGRAVDRRRGRGRALPLPDRRQGAARGDDASASTQPAERGRQVSKAAPLAAARSTSGTCSSELDLTQKLDKKKYETELENWQGRLNRAHARPEVSATLGRRWRSRASDAAGKGGAIRRITGALDARHYHVDPVAAPTEEERAQPYLWRFWRHMPRRGRVTIFDRSWYGRVLVERVEGFCSEADWMRAYARDQRLRGAARRARTIVLCKFWLHDHARRSSCAASRSARRSRFKRFKITDEDWRNREKWDAYEQAVCDMVDRTSTEIAPVDAGRGQRQVLRAHQGAEDPLPAHRARARRALIRLPAPQSGSMTTRYLLPFQNRAASVTVRVLAFGPTAESV